MQLASINCPNGLPIYIRLESGSAMVASQAFLFSTYLGIRDMHFLKCFAFCFVVSSCSLSADISSPLLYIFSLRNFLFLLEKIILSVCLFLDLNTTNLLKSRTLDSFKICCFSYQQFVGVFIRSRTFASLNYSVLAIDFYL